MKNYFNVVVTLMLFALSVNAEDIKPVKITSGFENVQNPDWGGDVLITSIEPLGSISGVARSNGTIYVAIPDTTTVPGMCLLVYKSTNFGDNWTRISSAIQGSALVTKTKMVKTGADSIYCVFLANNTLYYWNVENNSFNVHPTDVVRDYDVGITSSAVMYVTVDIATSNTIRRYATMDGGASYSQSATITSSGANPRVSPSATGDTIIVNYYGPILTDTSTSVIRSAIYRETSPGTFSSSNFVNVTQAGQPKREFFSITIGGIVMFIYVEGVPGSRDIKGYLSSNGGVSYPQTFDFMITPNVDEYWATGKANTHAPGGFDIAYFSDSTGTPGITSDKIIHQSALITSPLSFTSGTRVTQNFPPEYSTAEYKPELIEFQNSTGDLGVIWVGVDGASKRVYWNRMTQLTNIKNNSNQLAEKFELYQNYPNPFNPVTTIKFSIVENAYVSLKVYDMLGKEVANPVDQQMNSGVYEYQFDASGLSSGVYYYRLQAGENSLTRKMTVLK